MRLPSARTITIATVIGTFSGLSRPASVVAQQRPVPQLYQGLAVVPDVRTKLEFALTTPNALIHADFHNIDFRFGPNVRIDAVIVRVGAGPDVVRGVRVQVNDERRPGNPERSSYLDVEEIDALANALNSMVDLVRNFSAGDDRKLTALSFQSVDGFRVEIREAARFQRGFLFTGLVDPVVTPFELLDLTALKGAIDQASAVLKRR